MPEFDESLPARQGSAAFWHTPLLSLFVSIAGTSLPVAAGAQDAPNTVPAQATLPEAKVTTAKPPAKAASDSEGAQSVTITATRRREPAREVPMQVTAVSTAKLEQAGAKTMSDYLADIPGVDVKTAGGAGTGAISIRGVSTGDQTIATVGTYIDDVAVGSTSAFAAGAATTLDMGLLDLNHIELLRGPQGTLYGAGAMGGLLKYVTNEPDTYELTGKVSLGASATHGGALGTTVSAVINVPLKEDVAGLRVAAFREHVGGYVDAVGPAGGNNINGGDTTGGRISLLIEPSAHFKVRLTDTAQDLHRKSSDYVDYDATTGRPVNSVAARELTGREPYSAKINIAAADVEYDFGWSRLNSITSVQTTRLTQITDLTNPYAALLSGFGTAVDQVQQYQRSGVQKQTQEFRLTSPATGEFEWLGGLYYDRESGVNNQLISSELSVGGVGPDFVTVSIPSLYHEAAAYGDVTWNVAPKIQLTGGIRVARNMQTYGQVGDGLLLGGPSNIHSRSAETSETYLATARYALTTTSNVYFRAASGYRPGGPNAVVADPTTGQFLAPPTFKHDTLWSYEGGYKADLFDKTLSIEAAVFDIRWNQIQQLFAVNGINVIVNGGRAAVDGFELNATYRPTHQLSVVSSFAYNYARLTQNAPGLASSGSRLPNSPIFSGSLGVNDEFSLAGHEAYVGISERLVGERNAGFDASSTLPNYRIPSYALTDVQAGATFDRFQVALYVRNLFDKHSQVSAGTALVPAAGPVLVTEAKPRTVGVTLTTQF